MKGCHRERAPLPGPPLYVWVPNSLGRPKDQTARNLEITHLRIQGLTQREIGERFAITQSRVCQIEREMR